MGNGRSILLIKKMFPASTYFENLLLRDAFFLKTLKLSQRVTTASQHNITILSSAKKSKPVIVATKANSCIICQKGDHSVAQCEAFIRFSLDEKKRKVNQYKLCFNCLSLHHRVDACTSKYSCRNCGHKHHTLLHETTSTTNQPASQPTSSTNQTTSTSNQPISQPTSSTNQTTSLTSQPVSTTTQLPQILPFLILRHFCKPVKFSSKDLVVP